MQNEVTQEDAWRRFELWLFRECNEGTRRHLWAMFGLPIEEINNHGHERHALRYVKETLARHRHQAERAFEERERKLRAEMAVVQQSHDWMYGEKQRLENALKDIASRAHANLAQALKETPDAQ